MSSDEEFLDIWTMERVGKLYPDFKNGVNRISHIPFSADSIEMIDDDGYYRTVRFEHTLFSDGTPSRPIYNIVFKYGVLFVQDF